MNASSFARVLALFGIRPEDLTPAKIMESPAVLELVDRLAERAAEKLLRKLVDGAPELAPALVGLVDALDKATETVVSKNGSPAS